MKDEIHIVGIAGNGMCASAEVSLACGYCVTGSDRLWGTASAPRVLSTLSQAGCRITPQDGSGVTTATAAVVISSAIEDDNPDLVAARESNVPVYHRAQWLAKLIGTKRLLGIAGTSGKSSVTAMVGWILQEAGKEPFVVNGAGVSEWESHSASGHVRVGTTDLWVVELDESDRSFLQFSPQYAVITNETADHFSPADTAALFQSFRSVVSDTCLNPPWDVRDFVRTHDGSRFTFGDVSFHLPLIGLHNAHNAAAAAALAACIDGVDYAAAADALRSFPGVRRRLERYNCKDDILVFDDYSHNPEKIAAALDTVLPLVRNLTVVWRPHGYGPLRKMLRAFAATFARLGPYVAPDRKHRLLLLPVYDMGGTATRDIQSGDLASLVRLAGVETHCLATYAEVASYCARTHVHPGDGVLVMGARDPGLADLARTLARQHNVKT